ncbi:hypothetical protein FLA_2634 [Filimonas lacunae]|nr:hypothetical protein FLA_2634 [Filimonas lacunae]
MSHSVKVAFFYAKMVKEYTNAMEQQSYKYHHVGFMLKR